MNRSMIAVVAALLGFACRAEAGADAEDVNTNAVSVKSFTMLPLCRQVGGQVFVKLPNADWVPAQEGRYYPLGTSYRTGADGRLDLAFGPEMVVSAEAGAEFGTRNQELGCRSRTLVLGNGKVTVKAPNNLPEGLFFVTAPGFTVKSPAGESVYEYALTGDGDFAVIRCKTGTLGVVGRHFDIPVMRAANELRIRTSHDQLVSVLTGAGGDYVANVDQGLRMRDEFDDDGNLRRVSEKGVYACHLTPGVKVVINRAVPAIGERMSVHTMAFAATGDRLSECYFCEGRAEVNSGELVVQGQRSSEELAKRASELPGGETADGAAADGETAAGE